MLELLRKLVSSPSFRRFLAMLLGLGCAFLAKKFGLEISDEQQAKILDLVMLYLAQSGVVELAKVIKSKPAEPVASLEEAKSVLEKGPQP